VANGGSGSLPVVAMALLTTIVGGVVIGGAVAWLLLLVAGRTTDHLVEITLTTIAAYGSFLLAERFGGSGVLASLTAGLLVGNLGWKRAISEGGRAHVLSFWEYVAFLANSFVFILIGANDAHQPLGSAYGAAAIAILLVLAGRVLAVYPLCLLLAPTSLRISLPYQHVLFWGGLRGALALALALALPPQLAERQQIIVVAFAVVAFSIFVQGLTMPWLVRRLGFQTGLPNSPE
jgi:CPA1 family monovalent cation:H+ antiporter